MQLTAFKRELGKSRWGMDLVVCWLTATVFYLYIIWLTRMFETSPPDPRRLITNILIFAFGYSFSVFVGRIVLKGRSWSFVWVSIFGSAIGAMTMVLSALPGAIEYYNRFTPDPALAQYLVRNSVSPFLWITLSLTVVTVIAALVVRAIRSLFGIWSDWS